jgi:hypothetical protein
VIQATLLQKMMNKQPNNELYETQLGRSVHITKRIGTLAVGVALVGVSVAYYLIRKAGSGAKSGAERVVDSIATAVEYDYEDSREPVTIERTRKSS